MYRDKNMYCIGKQKNDSLTACLFKTVYFIICHKGKNKDFKSWIRQHYA
jgi:hypothetical protein